MDKNDMVTHYVWDCMVLWCCKTKPYTANSKRKMKKCHRVVFIAIVNTTLLSLIWN